MGTRVLVAVMGVPLLLLIVLWGPSPLLCGALCVLSGVGGLELQRCVDGDRDAAMLGFSAVLPVTAVLWIYAGGLSSLFRLLVILEIMLVFTYAIARERDVCFEQIAAALLAGLAIAWSFGAFVRMDAAGLPRVYLLLPFLLSFACDTCAYFAGRAFGRRKLAPVVSPHKTVEGSIGGMAGNLAAGLVFALILRGVLGPESVPGWGAAAALSLICGAAAQIGDLSFSLIKRQYGVKDYGKLFLDHGGVLDRFDSVLFVAPLVEAVLLWGR